MLLVFLFCACAVVIGVVLFNLPRKKDTWIETHRAATPDEQNRMIAERAKAERDEMNKNTGKG